MVKPVKAVVIGAGNRGKDVYGEYALQNPDKIDMVAVAEPIQIRRHQFLEKHKIPAPNGFETWEKLLEQDKLADVAIITTQDQMHTLPAITALKKGYDVLLEKPMATNWAECKEIVRIADQEKRKLVICHVLRYTPFFSKIKEVISSGKIGEVVNISLRENVSYYHYAHSFVRGNWHSREKSAPMILAKCSHDLDLLYWFSGSKPRKISSFGANTFFTKKYAPQGATDRCFYCPAANRCQFNALKIYINIEPIIRAYQKGGGKKAKLISKLALDHSKLYEVLSNLKGIPKKLDYQGWPVSTITDDLSLQGRLKALKHGPYGRCVFFIADHYVVDHQVVAIEFKNSVTATLTMQGHSHEEGRTIRIDGTKGTLKGSFLLSGDYLVKYNTLTGNKEVLLDINMTSGHGGGDTKLMDAFIDLITKKKANQKITSGKESLISHKMAFMADKARLANEIVYYAAFD